ncbi:lysophospholipid acyltransferase family protein [Patulibacter sp.]|uniref:lysophospholipid acyltransferase family protein n=1 Tax=Patulibacter sp. TaxID=1912859 RepID=UPI00271FB992|nr:lysophospholipid acyltransferase family protein [Patulibacter sp.]MDO9407090.1 lysophospholipid acyltransferase family protein [Patulibacter sp.]
MPRSSTPTDTQPEPAAAPAPRRTGRGLVPAVAVRGARGALDGLAAAAAQVGRTALAPVATPARGVLSAVGATARARVAQGDLDDRDGLLIRDAMPVAWMVASLWFRAEVRGLHHIPRDAPVLLVGNHSGGTVTPDSFVFALGFASHFGPERPLHVMVHNLVSAYPGLGFLRRLGTLPPDPDLAREALAAGSCVLVYPGGEHEAHRPSSESTRIRFDGRSEFVRLALDAGVPIVPVVAIGGQETALFLGRGERLARALGPGRGPRPRSLPVSLALPWGVNVGDLLGHLPLPAKIVVQVLPPIDVAARFGEDPDEQEVYDHVTGTMQEMLTELGRRRRIPVLGWEAR